MDAASERKKARFVKLGIVAGSVLFLGVATTFLWPAFSSWIREEFTIAPSNSVLPSAEARSKALASIPPSTLDNGSLTPANGAVNFQGAAAKAEPPANVSAVEMSDPLRLALSIRPQNPDLVDWLENWRKGLASNHVVSEHQRHVLEAILLESSLTSTQMLNLGVAFDNVSGDLKTAGVFFLTGVPLADQELAKSHTDAEMTHAILAAENRAKILLWDLYEKNSDPHYIDPLCTINGDMIKYVAPGEPGLESARQHGYIGMIECLTLAGKLKEAITFANSVDTSSMTDDQRVSFAWAYAYALRANRQYSDAIPQLEAVITSPKFKAYKQAYLTLIDLLIKTGNRDQAEQRAREYVVAGGSLPRSITQQLAEGKTP